MIFTLENKIIENYYESLIDKMDLYLDILTNNTVDNNSLKRKI